MTDLHARLTTIEVRNPADGSVVGTVPNDSADTVAVKARFAKGPMRAAAAHGLRRFGLKPKGGSR